MTTDPEPAHPAVLEEPLRLSVMRRHPLAFGIVGGMIGVVLVSGLTAWGVTAELAGAGSPVGAMAPMPSATGVTPSRANPVNGPAKALRGTIVAIAGSTWMIETKAGPAVTITVDSSTRYGTKAAPTSASDFAVGDSVAVIGMRSGDTAHANRVLKTTDGAGKKPAPSASPNT